MVKLKIPEVITEEELFKILNDEKVRNNKKHSVSYLLCFYQALRVSEVVKLTPEDYNPENKLIHIRQAKGSKDRKIPINPKCVKAIKYLPVGSSNAKDKGVRALQYAIKKDSKRILGKDIHPHTLRHSGATYYLNVKKWDTRQLQRFLGHTNIKITQLYLHVNPEDLTKLMWNE